MTIFPVRIRIDVSKNRDEAFGFAVLVIYNFNYVSVMTGY